MKNRFIHCDFQKRKISGRVASQRIRYHCHTAGQLRARLGRQPTFPFLRNNMYARPDSFVLRPTSFIGYDPSEYVTPYISSILRCPTNNYACCERSGPPKTNPQAPSSERRRKQSCVIYRWGDHHLILHFSGVFGSFRAFFVSFSCVGLFLRLFVFIAPTFTKLTEFAHFPRVA